MLIFASTGAGQTFVCPGHEIFAKVVECREIYEDFVDR